MALKFQEGVTSLNVIGSLVQWNLNLNRGHLNSFEAKISMDSKT